MPREYSKITIYRGGTLETPTDPYVIDTDIVTVMVDKTITIASVFDIQILNFRNVHTDAFYTGHIIEIDMGTRGDHDVILRGLIFLVDHEEDFIRIIGKGWAQYLIGSKVTKEYGNIDHAEALRDLLSVYAPALKYNFLIDTGYILQQIYGGGYNNLMSVFNEATGMISHDWRVRTDREVVLMPDGLQIDFIDGFNEEADLAEPDGWTENLGTWYVYDHEYFGMSATTAIQTAVTAIPVSAYQDIRNIMRVDAPVGWLSGFGYRKSHTITGSTDGAQTNYPVMLNVHRSTSSDSGDDVYIDTKCETDFDDIRFTLDDGTTELNYWLESVTGSDAIFWVDLPSIPASPTTMSIYIYYGDVDAVSDSDGEATFLFFDDFPGSSLDAAKWDTIGSPTVTVSGGTVTVSTATAAHEGIETDNAWGPYDLAIRSSASLTQVTQTRLGMADDISGVADATIFHNTAAGATGTNYNTGSSNAAITMDASTHVYEIQWRSGQTEFFTDDVSDNTNSASVPDAAISPTLWVYGSSGTSQIVADWIALRNWTQNAPSHTSWGSEESSTGDSCYIIFDYQSNTDFKYAGIDATNDQYQIGHYTGSRVADDTDSATITSGTDYRVRVVIDGLEVSLYSWNSTTELWVLECNYTFGSIGVGEIGLGMYNSSAFFDDFVIYSAGLESIDVDVDCLSWTIKKRDFSDLVNKVTVIGGKEKIEDDFSYGSLWQWGTDYGTGNGSITIVSEELEIVADSTYDVRQWSESKYKNTDITTDIRVPSGGVVIQASVLLRGTDDSNFYRVRMNGNSSTLDFTKVVSGTPTTIQTVAYTFSASTIYEIRVKATDENFKVYVDGVSQMDFEDSTYTTGYAGLGAESSTAYFDDVTILTDRDVVASASDPALIDKWGEKSSDPVRDGTIHSKGTALKRAQLELNLYRYEKTRGVLKMEGNISTTEGDIIALTATDVNIIAEEYRIVSVLQIIDDSDGYVTLLKVSEYFPGLEDVVRSMSISTTFLSWLGLKTKTEALSLSDTIGTITGTVDTYIVPYYNFYFDEEDTWGYTYWDFATWG